MSHTLGYHFDDPESKDPTLVRHKEQIRRVFALFDPDSRGVCPKQHVGTIIRALGVFPTEDELQRVIMPQIRDDLDFNHIKFVDLERFMLRALMKKLYEPDSEETILDAFRTLFPNTSDVSANELQKVLLENEDPTDDSIPLNDNEFEVFMQFACENETRRVRYTDYVNKFPRLN